MVTVLSLSLFQTIAIRWLVNNDLRSRVCPITQYYVGEALSNENSVQATVSLSISCTRQVLLFQLEEGLEVKLEERNFIVWSQPCKTFKGLPKGFVIFLNKISKYFHKLRRKP